jgi:phosphoenolpyruvate carboxykinase (GTP)
VIGVDGAAWVDELKLHDELFAQLAYHLPKELTQVKTRIEERLSK